MSTPLKYDAEFSAALESIADRLHTGPKPVVGDVEARRRNAMEGFLISRLPPVTDVTRRDDSVESRDGTEVTVAEFQKTGGVSKVAVIYVHGGGMIRGSVDAFQRAIENNCSLSGVRFFCSDYRLAPEHPYPAAIDDCFATLQWVRSHSSELQIDASRIIIMGESAGGGLAGLEPPLSKKILTFPMLDDRNQKPLPGIEPALLGESAGKFDAVSPYAAPARASTLEGLPPTYIECGQLDIVSFENMRYASRSMEARVPLELHIYPGQPHGFMALAPGARYSKLAFSNVLAAIASA